MSYEPAAQWQPYPPPVQPKKRMGCLRMLGIAAGALVGVLVLLGIVGAILGAGEESDEGDGAGDVAAAEDGAPAGDGPETDSNNETNPPPDDINDDLSCTSEPFLGPKASGTLTNHSSELSGYIISVGFLDAAGTRVADGAAFVNNVQAGQTATWEAVAFSEVAYETCEIVSVERMAQ